MKWHRDFVIVTFYTPDYKKFADRLLETARDRLPTTLIHAEEISQREWGQATCHKASFILNKIKKFKKPVLWVDADATIETHKLMMPDVDFAVYARFQSKLRKRFAPFRTGTVYFDYTPQSLDLLNRWRWESELQKDGIDQWSLFRAWCAAMLDRDYMPTTHFFDLSYCQKKDEGPGAKIKHYMASRTHKRRK